MIYPVDSAIHRLNNWGLKYYAMSHVQKTKLSASHDETSDNGLGETLETFGQSKDATASDQTEGSKFSKKKFKK